MNRGEKEMKYISEFCFLNVGIDTELKKHHQAMEDGGENLDGVDFLGLFIPMNEYWNWSYFFKTESIGKYADIRRTTEMRYGGRPESFSSSLWRFYEKYNLSNLEEKPRKSDWKQKYMFAILFQSKGITIDLKDKHEMVTDLFKEKEKVELLGLYTPRNEAFDWTYFFRAESWEVAAELESEILKIFGHHSGSFITSITRMYERVQL